MSLTRNKTFLTEFLSEERSFLKRYTFALFASTLSLVLVHFVWQVEGGLPLTSLALSSVILSAIYGGKGPAVLDTMITSLGIDYFFDAPLQQIFDSTSSIVRVIIYVTLGISVAVIMDMLRNSLRFMKDQNEQLKFEKKARENVLAIVSHDLRSPLSSIMMNTELILREEKSAEENYKNLRLLENIRNSCKRMNRLIEDILDSVKIESGQFKIDKTQNDLVEAVTESIRESQSAALAKGINLKFDRNLESFICDYDQGRIIQILNNLLGNAIKFSPHNSEVTVSMDVEENQCVVAVKDSGQGIPPGEQDQLFNRYWQSQETAHKGTGLGLYISKKIVEAHGGNIGVFSKFGHGATFFFSLPIKPLKAQDRFIYDAPLEKNSLNYH